MKKVDTSNFIWAERYRPQVLDDVILPEATRKKFKGYLDEGRFPHTLLSSTFPGLGKCLHEDEEMELWVEDDIYDLLTN